MRLTIQSVLDLYPNVVEPDNERHGPALPGATGLAAYMPLTGEYFDDSIDAYRNSGRFAQAGGWADMLTRYHEILALDATPPDVGPISVSQNNQFATAEALLNSDDTAQAFALTFALIEDTFVFVGQAPVVPKNTDDGTKLSFKYNYDAAYLEQGDTSLYASASYDYGPGLQPWSPTA